mgnify:CR=1 FL=1
MKEVEARGGNVVIVTDDPHENIAPASTIVDFFQKSDEQRRVRRDIKRTIIEEFDDLDLVKPVTDRFMELAEVKFR